MICKCGKGCASPVDNLHCFCREKLVASVKKGNIST